MLKVKIGDVFITNEGYSVEVLHYQDPKNILIRFIDDNKYEKYVQFGHLKKGAISNPYHKSVCKLGFIGVGKHLIKENNRHTLAYKTWHSMMHRCYDPAVKIKNPTYEDCIVAEEWHNFQNFAEWFYSQKYCNDGYELDKDWLVANNKVYSPEFCLLAPKKINCLVRGHKRKDETMPMGVYKTKFGKPYISMIRIDGNLTMLGTFDDRDEAHNVYKVAKISYIKKVALEWQDKIDERLFTALMNKVI